LAQAIYRALDRGRGHSPQPSKWPDTPPPAAPLGDRGDSSARGLAVRMSASPLIAPMEASSFLTPKKIEAPTLLADPALPAAGMKGFQDALTPKKIEMPCGVSCPSLSEKLAKAEPIDIPAPNADTMQPTKVELAAAVLGEAAGTPCTSTKVELLLLPSLPPPSPPTAAAAAPLLQQPPLWPPQLPPQLAPAMLGEIFGWGTCCEQAMFDYLPRSPPPSMPPSFLAQVTPPLHASSTPPLHAPSSPPVHAASLPPVHAPSLPPSLPAELELLSLGGNSEYAAPSPTRPGPPEVAAPPPPPAQPPSLPEELLRDSSREEFLAPDAPAWAVETAAGTTAKLQLPAKALGWDSSEGFGGSWLARDGDVLADLEQESIAAASPSDEGRLRFPPGLRPPPGTPSHGSSLHGTGKCRPCAWFWKTSGCQNGPECGHCHLCPEGEIKARKKAKLTVMRLGLATPKDIDIEDASAALSSVPIEEMARAATDSEGNSSKATNHGAFEHDSTTCSSSSEKDPELNQEAAELSSEKGQHVAQLQDPTQTGAVTPTEAPDEVQSANNLGSALHGWGTCRPCAWFWKPSGCQNSVNCEYCHVCPEGELKARKKSKQTMMRLGLATPKSDIMEKEAKFALDLAPLL